MARKVLRIIVWDDPVRGHEVQSRSGHKTRGPLKWFRAPVHTGEWRRRIREDHGEEIEDMCVSVYDVFCQESASQIDERRGFLFNSRGAPLTISAIASLTGRSKDRLSEAIRLLIHYGSVEWVQVSVQTDRESPDERRSSAGRAQVRATLARGCAPKAESKAEAEAELELEQEAEQQCARQAGANSSTTAHRRALAAAAYLLAPKGACATALLSKLLLGCAESPPAGLVVLGFKREQADRFVKRHSLDL